MGYYLAYKTLMFKHCEMNKFYNENITYHYFPEIVNLAFAIELSLKSLIQKQILRKGESSETTGHDLYKLFTLLDGKVQNKIIQNTLEMNSIKSIKLRKQIDLSETLFRCHLKKSRNIFKEVRYFHEAQIGMKINMDFLETLLFGMTSEESDYESFLDRIIDLRSEQEKRNKRFKEIFELTVAQKISKLEGLPSKEEFNEIGKEAYKEIADYEGSTLAVLNSKFISLIDLVE